jgi:GTPase
MLTKEHMSRMETAEMRFVITVTGCRMTDYERVEDTRERM